MVKSFRGLSNYIGVSAVLFFLFVLVGIMGVTGSVYGLENGQSPYEEAALRLGRYGIVKGGPTGLDLQGGLTREQALALYIRALNEEGAAGAYGSSKSTFLDVRLSDWYNSTVVYGFLKGYTTGIGGGKFGSGVPVISQEYMAFMLRGLGYNVPYDSVMAKADELKLLDGITRSPYHYINRGEAFLVLNRVMDLPRNGKGTPLSAVFEDLLVPTDDGVTMLSAQAIDGNSIRVVLSKNEAVDERRFTLTSSDGASVRLNSAVAVDKGEALVLNCETMQVGKAYTLKMGTKSIAVVPYTLSSLDFPRIITVKALSQNQLRVVLSTTLVDWASINSTNFTVDQGVVVSEAYVDSSEVASAEYPNKLVLTLWVTALDEARGYTLTGKNLMSYKGNSGSSTVAFVSSTLDTVAPVMLSAQAVASDMVKVTFEDATALDGNSLKTENFSISPTLNIRSVSTGASEVPGQFVVYLLTDYMTGATAYEVAGNRISDGMNIMQGAQKRSFTGLARLMHLAPLYAKAVKANVIEVAFQSPVHMESLSPRFFELGSGYAVSKVDYAEDPYMPGGLNRNRLWLTTDTIQPGQSLKVMLNKALKDVEGLGMLEDQLYYVSGIIPDSGFDGSVVAFGIDETTAKLVFAEAVDESSATNVLNYYAQDLGYASYASLGQDKRTVYLTLPFASRGKVVVLGLSNIKDLSGNTIDSGKKVYYVIPN